MPKTNAGPHPFTIKDEDLFRQGEQSAQAVRTISCGVCGDKPGQGVHTPPPPPLHTLIAEEVAKTLSSSTLSESRALNWTQLTGPAARAAFTTIQKVRTALDEMSKRPDYDDPDGTSGYVFSNIDTELDNLLTQLRHIGWDRK